MRGCSLRTVNNKVPIYYKLSLAFFLINTIDYFAHQSERALASLGLVLAS
jgi:hypothetical protein